MTDDELSEIDKFAAEDIASERYRVRELVAIIRGHRAKVAELEARIEECEQWPSPRYTDSGYAALEARGFQHINMPTKSPATDKDVTP